MDWCGDTFCDFSIVYMEENLNKENILSYKLKASVIQSKKLAKQIEGLISVVNFL